ncbi:MAG TPA: type II toxin-antitoxin system VapC family toxin [Gemmataceae bacterium]|nr:type II toxin-antitoxin system VapC family toxin [Gemmataceae bacterium]
MTTPYVCVVDASVAAQLVVPEPLSGRAAQLFSLLDKGQATFHVPDLFYAECANIFWKKAYQRGVCSPAEAAKALDDLQALPLLRTTSFDLAGDALALALAHGTSAYDACYAALARRLGVPLITADQRLEQKLAGTGLAVVWLGNWTPPAPSTP